MTLVNDLRKLLEEHGFHDPDDRPTSELLLAEVGRVCELAKEYLTDEGPIESKTEVTARRLRTMINEGEIAVGSLLPPMRSAGDGVSRGGSPSSRVRHPPGEDC